MEVGSRRLLILSSKKNRCGKVAATNHLAKKGFWTHFNNKSSNKQSIFFMVLNCCWKRLGEEFLNTPSWTTRQHVFRGLKQLQEVSALNPFPGSQAAFDQGSYRTCKSFQALRRHQPRLFPSTRPFSIPTPPASFSLSKTLIYLSLLCLLSFIAFKMC